jgi:hypothetical protein
MKARRIWVQAAVLLALIWGVVMLVMRGTDSYVSWPEKVIVLAEEAPWLHGEKNTASDRKLHLHKVITHLNRLKPEQKRRLREDGQEALDRFSASLTEEEQKEFVNRTIEPHFESISKTLKLLPQEERKRLIGRLRTDLKSLRGESTQGNRLSEQDQEFMDFMIADDPILFLREAPIQVKMELAPVLEDLLSRLQGMRR